MIYCAKRDAPPNTPGFSGHSSTIVPTIPVVRQPPRQPLVVIAGPTGSGKTGLSLVLAEEFGGEVVSADSMQVYKLMDIGTAKPSQHEKERIPHHLLDIVYPDEPYNAARYRHDADQAIADVSGRGKAVFVVGGTGLYIKALTRGLFSSPQVDESARQSLRDEMSLVTTVVLYEELQNVDPRAAERIHAHDRVRITRALEVFHLTGRTISSYQSEHGFPDSPYDHLKICLDLDRADLYKKIERRAAMMFEIGLVEEVKELLAAGYTEDLKPLQSLGYRHVIRYLHGEHTLDETLSTMVRDTRRYAKRQLTWFRADPEVVWVDPADLSGIVGTVRGFLDRRSGLT